MARETNQFILTYNTRKRLTRFLVLDIMIQHRRSKKAGSLNSVSISIIGAKESVHATACGCLTILPTHTNVHTMYTC